jgi:hypothetical protein
VEITGSSGTPSSGVSITGLPFSASSSLATAAYTSELSYSNLDIPAGFTSVVGIVNPSSSTISLQQQGDNIAQASLSGSAILANTTISGSFMYQI